MAAAEVQALLRFLTQDAKIPLGTAMVKYNQMRKEGLITAESIAKADPDALKAIFPDAKELKQVLNAAKRVSNPKKRTASQASLVDFKRLKQDNAVEDPEAALALPEIEMSVDELNGITIETNRAPLFLAFALTVLKYTMSEQPLSSRLSLAQAVTSAGAQSKAKYIGLTTGATPEEDGWAVGQPKTRVMGREIAVMRRHVAADTLVIDSEKEIKAEEQKENHDAFWGIDLEALRKSNGPLVAGKLNGTQGPPIHSAQGARAYLFKSLAIRDPKDASVTSPNKKPSAAEVAARKERAVATLLKAIGIVCESWSATLTKDELDRRANSWYSLVRPDVEPGQAGWGQRGQVPLEKILKLRKT